VELFPLAAAGLLAYWVLSRAIKVRYGRSGGMEGCREMPRPPRAAADVASWAPAKYPPGTTPAEAQYMALGIDSRQRRA
jgi:hypothetical protein